MKYSKEERAEAEEAVLNRAARLDWDVTKTNQELAKIDDGTSSFLPDKSTFFERVSTGDPNALGWLAAIIVVLVVLFIVAVVVLSLIFGDASMLQEYEYDD